MLTSKDARLAAVMLLIFPDDIGNLHIVLTKRASSNQNDRHSGQMSFPGGKKDDVDTSLETTALRETNEEIGVHIDDIEVLGKLTPLYIPVSNFSVHPYVGYIDYWPEFVPEEREVAQIIISPFQYLLDYIIPSRTDIQVTPSILLKDIPYYNVNDQIVWGATSMMLCEFLMAVRARIH